MFDFENSYYPITKIPKELVSIKLERISIPDVPLKPSAPRIEETSHAGKLVLVFGMLGAIILSAIIQPNNGGVLVLVWIPLVIGLYWILYENRRNKEIVRHNNIRNDEYCAQMKAYETKVEQRNYMLEITSDKKKKAFYLQKQKQFFVQKLAGIKNYDNPRAGITEKRFESYLKKYFNERIATDVIMDIGNEDDLPYVPDFVYIDKKRSLFIDIEIDEPYTMDSRKPLHYMTLNGNHIDGVRDLTFNEQGWLVIRFTEEHVVKYPNECCKFIASIVSYYGEDTTVLDSFYNIDDLPKIEQWSKHVAEQLEEKDYREAYLKTIGINARNNLILNKDVFPLKDKGKEPYELPF